MEKIHENTCKQACSYVFKQENYIKAHVLMYFLQLVLTFTPHYIIMVKGLYVQNVGATLRKARCTVHAKPHTLIAAVHIFACITRTHILVCIYAYKYKH